MRFEIVTIVDTDTLLEFARLGVYCQFDLFGIEDAGNGWVSDTQRVDCILKLFNEGHEKQVLMSSDVHSKHRLV